MSLKNEEMLESASPDPLGPSQEVEPTGRRYRLRAGRFAP